MNDEKLLSEIVQRLVAIEVKLEEIIKVKEDVEDLKKEFVRLDEKDKNQQKEINELRDTNRWLARAVAGGILTGIITIIFIFIKIGLGVN